MAISIGASYATLSDFPTLGIREPVAKPVIPYFQTITKQNNQRLGVGFPQAVLEWPAMLSTAERDILRTLIPGASASLYFILPDESYDETTYTGIAIWPDLRPENSQAPRFVLQIVNLVEYTP